MIDIRRLAAADSHKRVSGQTTTERMWLLCAVAVLLGLIGGGAAVVLFKGIGLITHIVLLHNIGTSLPTLRHYHASPTIIITSVAGALVVSLLAAWSPVIRGHGIPESLETILTKQSRISPRAALAKPLSAAITIGTGGPFGAEGPIIVTAGSLGSLIGQFLSTSPMERRIMLATGAAAGMAGTFNAPIASIILALELVMFERSLRTVIPLAIACGIAASIHMLVFGTTPLFAIHETLHYTLGQLPWYVLVGIAAGGLAVVFNKGLFALEALWRALPLKIFWWPMIGAVCFSLIGLIDPRSLSMGYSAISDTLNGRFVVGALAALFFTKLISWLISLSSQTSGGTLAPMFLAGATMGALFGHGLNAVVPGLGIVPQAFALVAMGAAFGAATKAPFTSVVFAFEVTGQYHMVIPLMIGVASAELVAQLFLSERIMTEKLSHRGFRVDFRSEVDPLRMRIVGQIMREPVTLAADASATQARVALAQADVPAGAAIDASGRYLGVVRASDLTTWRARELPRAAAVRVGQALDGNGRSTPATAILRAAGEPSDGHHATLVGGPRTPGPRPTIRPTQTSRAVAVSQTALSSQTVPTGQSAPAKLTAAANQAAANEKTTLGHAADPSRSTLTGQVTPPLGRSLPIHMLAAPAPSDFLVRALTLMIEHGLSELPVVENGRVVGRIRRSDIAARRVLAYREREAIQPGWAQDLLARRHARGGGTTTRPTERRMTAPGDDVGAAAAADSAGASADGAQALSEADYRRLFEFRAGLNRYLRWSEERIREAGITPGQYQLLLAIRELGPDAQGPTVQELSKPLCRGRDALHELVESALEQGLVEAHTDSSKPPATHLKLTASGEQRLAELVELHAVAIDWHPPSLDER